jgi:hypothetical protein
MTATATSLLAETRANLERAWKLLEVAAKKVEQAERLMTSQKVFTMPQGGQRLADPPSGARPHRLVPVEDTSLPRQAVPDAAAEQTIVTWLKSIGWNVASTEPGRWSLSFGSRRRSVDRIGLLEVANGERRRFHLPAFAYAGARHV